MNIKLKTNTIKIDPSYQPRVEICNVVVADYAKLLLEGTHFPPIVVSEISNESYVVISGAHRLQAHIKAGINEIEAELRTGSKMDLLREAIQSNSKHGVKYTNKDKWRCVELLLRGNGSNELSDHFIGQITGVSNHLVKKIKKSLEETKDGCSLDSVHKNTLKPKTASVESVNRLLSSKSCDLVKVLEIFQSAHSCGIDVPSDLKKEIENFIEWFSAIEKAAA